MTCRVQHDHAANLAVDEIEWIGRKPQGSRRRAETIEHPPHRRLESDRGPDKRHGQKPKQWCFKRRPGAALFDERKSSACVIGNATGEKKYGKRGGLADAPSIAVDSPQCDPHGKIAAVENEELSEGAAFDAGEGFSQMSASCKVRRSRNPEGRTGDTECKPERPQSSFGRKHDRNQRIENDLDPERPIYAAHPRSGRPQGERADDLTNGGRGHQENDEDAYPRGGVEPQCSSSKELSCASPNGGRGNDESRQNEEHRHPDEAPPYQVGDGREGIVESRIGGLSRKPPVISQMIEGDRERSAEANNIQTDVGFAVSQPSPLSSRGLNHPPPFVKGAA